MSTLQRARKYRQRQIMRKRKKDKAIGIAVAVFFVLMQIALAWHFWPILAERIEQHNKRQPVETKTKVRIIKDGKVIREYWKENPV